MDKMIFPLPGNERMAASIAEKLGAGLGKVGWRNFPDGETYVRVESDCKGREAIVLASLHHPNEKILGLLFLADTLRELGAARVLLVAPYLAYLRQDRRFQEGEAVTSRSFAEFLSAYFDGLITVDPHLHRYASLGEIYSIPAKVVHATPLVADWVRKHVSKPVLIGPDRESEQWVADVARRAEAPYVILTKARRGDRDVEVSIPQIEEWRERNPVLVDDIISSGRTMIETIGQVLKLKLPAPVCLGIHAVFGQEDYKRILQAGTAEVVTSNTIPHETNRIDVSEKLAEAMGEWEFLEKS